MSKIKVEQFVAKIDELTPTENNPRQISKQDFENLKKSMKEFPEMREIRKVVVDENNRILGGHMRIKALKDLGESEVPVDKVYGLTEKQKQRFVVQDNIQNGEWDMDELANSWSELPLDDWGVDFKNLGDIDFGDIESTSDRQVEKKPIKVVCPDCGREFEV